MSARERLALAIEGYDAVAGDREYVESDVIEDAIDELRDAAAEAALDDPFEPLRSAVAEGNAIAARLLSADPALVPVYLALANAAVHPHRWSAEQVAQFAAGPVAWCVISASDEARAAEERLAPPEEPS